MGGKGVYIAWTCFHDDKCVLGDDLRIIIKQLQLHNVLERREDRHLVTPGALTVDQLKDELAQRGLPIKGKKAVLVARLTEAIGNGKVQIKGIFELPHEKTGFLHMRQQSHRSDVL